MIKIEKAGAELADKIAEIERLENCEEVKVARDAQTVNLMLDRKLRELMRLEREGADLIQSGITMEKLQEYVEKLGIGGCLS